MINLRLTSFQSRFLALLPEALFVWPAAASLCSCGQPHNVLPLLLVQYEEARQDLTAVQVGPVVLINNIPRGAKWIVFIIELNLLLLCFGLSALYLPTPDPARRPSITPPPCRKHVLIWLAPPFSYVGMLFIYTSKPITQGRKFLFLLPILYKMFEKPLVMVLVPF